jgi:nucleoside 2-deoxyribosyltransferase
MKIYLARAISGCSYEEVRKYYEDMYQIFQPCGYDILCPMTAKGELRNELEFRPSGYDNTPTATNHAIIERDRWMCKMADVVFVNLLGTKNPSIGCCMELAWAHDAGKHTIVVMEKVNTHRHAFVLEAADVVFENQEDAIRYICTLQNGLSAINIDPGKMSFKG